MICQFIRRCRATMSGIYGSAWRVPMSQQWGLLYIYCNKLYLWNFALQGSQVHHVGPFSILQTLSIA